MKNLIFLIVPFLFFVTSCDKSKTTVCPAITCEYGMNPATCACNPKPVDPNDTTGNGNGNGNGGNDTTTPTPIVSVFGNGSNGTYDTTTNYFSNIERVHLFENQYELLKKVFPINAVTFNVVPQKEELLKNGTLVSHIKYNDNIYTAQAQKQYIIIRDYDNVADNNAPADIILTFGNQSIENLVNMYNEENKTFFINPAYEPETFGDYSTYFSDLSNANIKNAKLTMKILKEVNNSYVYFYKIQFKVGNDTYEYRAVYQ